MASLAFAEDDVIPAVEIADPFIEMRTGPAGAYPIFHVVDRGELVQILRRRTNWFEIKSESGKQGWASRDQMIKTLKLDGSEFAVSDATADDFLQSQWTLAVMGGEFESAPVISITGAHLFTRNFSSELSLSHSVGNVSSSTLFKANAVMQPLPDLSWSPIFTLGAGQIKVEPSSTLITPNSTTNLFGQIGFGVQHYLSRRFIFRFEVSEYIIFSASNDDDSNEGITEWKTGFAVFF